MCAARSASRHRRRKCCDYQPATRELALRNATHLHLLHDAGTSLAMNGGSVRRQNGEGEKIIWHSDQTDQRQAGALKIAW